MSIQEPFIKQREQYVLDTSRQKLRVASTWSTKLRTYFTLPQFSIENVWRGASEIVKEFSYSLSAKTSIINLLQNTPANPNFVACVAWKPISETIVRYKLWEDVGEILYVPLYSGQTINADFSIEIWNTQPVAGSSGDSIIFESGDALVTEETSDAIVTEEGGDLIGTIITTSNAEDIVVMLSTLVIPSSKCPSSNSRITAYDECTDVTFNFNGGTYDTTYIPFDGDYYIVAGVCGVTTLVKGSRFSGTELILQSTDETWHRIYTMRFGGITYLAVDQDNALPSLTPHIYLQQYPGVTYRVDLQLLQGNHHIRVDQNASTELDYTVLYLQTAEDSLYYGLRLVNSEGNIHFQVAQDNTIL